MFLHRGNAYVMIRKQDPLKQGLKHHSIQSMCSMWSIRKQDPLKQGLKQSWIWIWNQYRQHSKARSTKTRIETEFDNSIWINIENIRKQDPLKQGLKLLVRDWFIFHFFDSKARSTKTRIETQSLLYPLWAMYHSKARSTKTRIETPHYNWIPAPLFKIRKQDPLKQGLKLEHCLVNVIDFIEFESKIH